MQGHHSLNWLEVTEYKRLYFKASAVYWLVLKSQSSLRISVELFQQAQGSFPSKVFKSQKRLRTAITVGIDILSRALTSQNRNEWIAFSPLQTDCGRQRGDWPRKAFLLWVVWGVTSTDGRDTQHENRKKQPQCIFSPQKNPKNQLTKTKNTTTTKKNTKPNTKKPQQKRNKQTNKKDQKTPQKNLHSRTIKPQTNKRQNKCQLPGLPVSWYTN